MKILHSGWFLQEGFRQAGCQVTPLRLNPEKSLNALIEDSGCDPDVVCIELFGRTDLPRDMHLCRHKLAVYCVDSPLNEFWHIPLASLADYVYVDQLSSVPRFQRRGVRAAWLPLCAQSRDLREPTPKEHFLTFVGRTSPERIKRSNLLAHISRHFDINLVQNVDRTEMLDIFARSRVVLNENFFSGVNVRSFHAMSAGSVLLSESNGHGMGRLFQNGEHYAGYTPDNILSVLAHLSRNAGVCEDIAAHGAAECRARHLSVHRAERILHDLRGPRRRPAVSGPDRKVREAEGKYGHALAFSGGLGQTIELLADMSGVSPEERPEAWNMLGRIFVRREDIRAGVDYLEKGAAGSSLAALNAALSLAFIFQDTPRFLALLARVTDILRALRVNPDAFSRYIFQLPRSRNRLRDFCLFACQVLYELGHVYALGLRNAGREKLPSYALEYALAAFQHHMDSETLAALIMCLDKIGVEAEALPYIKQAINAGVAAPDQIERSVTLALEYYDFTYAASILNILKQHTQ